MSTSLDLTSLLKSLEDVRDGHQLPTPVWRTICDEIRRLREQVETRDMQLAACMTATIQNTPTTTKDRIDRDNPYWCQAYADVCVAIDREMRERTRAETAESLVRDLAAALETVSSSVALGMPFATDDAPACEELLLRINVALAALSRVPAHLRK